MMKGLITKEILVLIKNNKMQFLCLLMFVVLGVFMKSAAYIMFIPFLIPMLVKQGLTVDEMSKWDKYSACFPVDRKKIVTSKYIVVLLSAVLSSAMALAAFILINIVNKDKVLSLSDIAVYLTAASSISIVLPAFMYPFDFKYGTAKGRVVYFILTGIAVAGLSSAFMGADVTSFLSKLTQPLVIAVIFAAALTIFIVSWFISAKIYEAREI
ncbi:MAG: ABC-2 transporter permease [Ruminococcus sp.]|uniref:ABC-2 transporter permease n=1 Tax=Ruminococcus sp. TaxID=41978 RepID=UPI001B1DE8E1|nr:ABC-2 transporter permease [Ruminococcus sp.]MBO7474775.1 ABC-2 transporter permease [Ruminococcus sp.]